MDIDVDALEQYRKNIKPCMRGYCQDSAWDELADGLFAALRQQQEALRHHEAATVDWRESSRQHELQLAKIGRLEKALKEKQQFLDEMEEEVKRSLHWEYNSLEHTLRQQQERCRELEEALQSIPSPPIRGERLTAFGWFTYSGWLQWVVDARAALKRKDGGVVPELRNVGTIDNQRVADLISCLNTSEKRCRELEALLAKVYKDWDGEPEDMIEIAAALKRKD